MTERHEPDYRFTLANERTFLAWLRTSLALDAGAIAVVSLVPEIGPRGTREAVGVGLAVLGLAVAVGALRRWKRVQEAMERDEDLPRSWMPLLLSIGLGVVGVVVAVLVVVAR